MKDYVIEFEIFKGDAGQLCAGQLFTLKDFAIADHGLNSVH